MRAAGTLLMAAGFAALVTAAYGQAAMDDNAMIASAMTAAPAAVGAGAKIVAMDDKGAMRTLRDGNNGFACMPDNPVTPGPDPMCMDANAMEWVDAWIKHATPPEKVGFIYMLAGGTDGSNTDPYAAGPAPGNHWVETGPHVMVVGMPKMMAGYPRGADPDTANPYVMWPDTPYEHVMIPVK